LISVDPVLVVLTNVIYEICASQLIVLDAGGSFRCCVSKYQGFIEYILTKHLNIKMNITNL
jgi:hypothetical protein